MQIQQAKGGKLKVSMTDPELTSFLSANKTIRLASISPDGRLHVVPLAFMYEHRKLYSITKDSSRKVGNIKNNGKVAFSVDDDKNPMELKGVTGSGTARILPPGQFHDEILAKLITHLVGSLEHPFAKVMMKPTRVIIEITPSKMTSWKNAFESYMSD